MKIAYLTNIRFPSERAHSAQIAHMCQAFVENGAEMNLIVNTRRSDSKQEIDDLFQFDSKFQIVRLPYGLFSARFKLAFYISESIFTLSFLLRGLHKKYDVIFSRSQIILWLLSFFVPTERLVWESHDGVVNFFSRQILKRGVKTVVTSAAQVKLLNKYTEKILLAPNAIDASFFGQVDTKEDARKRSGLNLNEKIVMYIGGFDTWKGVHTLFNLSQYDNDFQIVIIGGSEEEITEFQKIYPKILFLGQRPYSELKDNQQAADILVVPNTAKNELSEKFTSPLKLFAHMASNIPLVLSDIESIKNVVPGGLATYFEPDNSESLKKVLEEVFGDYDRKQGDAKSLRDFSIKYTWENRAKNIYSFISKN